MDLERNLIDNILECEIKLGYENMPIGFYYPLNSLLELLACDRDTLPQAICAFQKKELHQLGVTEISELKHEKDRYQVQISAKGVAWVSENFTPTEFMKAFVHEVKKPGQTLEKIVELFRSFSDEVIIRIENENEWAISFADDQIDPYVYCMEQNLFGLEYHRFTKKAYQELFGE